MTRTFWLVLRAGLLTSVITMLMRFVVEAWALVGAQSNAVAPFFVDMMVTPAGAPAPRLKEYLSWLFTGGVSAYLRTAFGAMTKLVTGVGATTFTPNVRMMVLLVVPPSSTI